MKGLGDALRKLAADPIAIQTAHIALEDELIELRDDRISLPFRANGLVIREKNGQASDAIRIPTDEAVRRVLKILAEYVDTNKDGKK